MTTTYQLHIKLLSDATFGRGDGVAGLVDTEVEHDSATGLPYIGGRTIKGLLVEECANLLYVLGNSKNPGFTQLEKAATELFGVGGSGLESAANMRVGSAYLPHSLINYVKASGYTADAILQSLTTIRRQTAIDETTGVASKGSLRSSRVVLRETTFIAALDFFTAPVSNSLALLATCAACVRYGGSGRNRGRGRLQVSLTGPDKFNFEQAQRNFARIIDPVISTEDQVSQT